MTDTIAIVGGGISGTITVLNCIKQSRKPLSIIWFDAHNKFCKGFAYSTTEKNHLLNVRANNMSVFVDEPNHFVNWLNQNHPDYTAKDFVARKLFGEYVQDVFETLKQNNPLVSIVQIAEEVTSINRIKSGFELKSNKTYQAKKLVLAFGNFLPAHPRSVSRKFISSDNYFQNAFHPQLIQKTLKKKNITIIGSGLTMIDVVSSLSDKQYKGTIRLISPHGYIPQAHQEDPLPPVMPFIDEHKKYNLLELISVVNQQLKKAKKEGLSQNSVIDVMRPFSQNIWLNFSVEEKKQFLRHLRHRWGVARHRVPGKSMAVFQELNSSGNLVVTKGRIFDIKTETDGFEIYYSTIQNSKQVFNTDLIINCTGPESNYLQIKSGLIQQLIKNLVIEPDSIKYGINAQKDGQISQNVYTIGPPLKGILWESTAVPEIRVQAQELVSKNICN